MCLVLSCVVGVQHGTDQPGEDHLSAEEPCKHQEPLHPGTCWSWWVQVVIHSYHSCQPWLRSVLNCTCCREKCSLIDLMFFSSKSTQIDNKTSLKWSITNNTNELIKSSSVAVQHNFSIWYNKKKQLLKFSLQRSTDRRIHCINATIHFFPFLLSAFKIKWTQTKKETFFFFWRYNYCILSSSWRPVFQIHC